MLNEATSHFGSNIFLPSSVFLPNLGLHGVTFVIDLRLCSDCGTS
ncbi:hypothetical protein Rcae01_02980 [Novipirellula caenicola]|uniref:Uncharacterized protein n=1 Tax=Novipirellula caenicola TaxID=1536901 RepID=A0ABP9VQT5_9BACT